VLCHGEAPSGVRPSITQSIACTQRRAARGDDASYNARYMTASLLSATPRDCNPALNCNLVRALLLGCAIPAAQAGPPLSIDDPGILAPGQWEIIAAATAASTDSEDAY